MRLTARCRRRHRRRTSAAALARPAAHPGRTAPAAARRTGRRPGSAASSRTRTVGWCSSRCTTRCTVCATSARCSSVRSGARLAQPAQLGGDHLVGAGPQRGHGRRDVGAAQPAGTRRPRLATIASTAASSAPSCRSALSARSRGGEPLHVDRVTPGSAADGRVDVARARRGRGRPAGVTGRAVTCSRRQHVPGRGGRADHQVDLGDRVGEVGERHRGRAVQLGQPVGPRPRSRLVDQ